MRPTATMPVAPKVLLIGLDAAEVSCIEQWATEGHLPNLSRLISEGAMTHMQSAAAEFPDEVWPSIYTSTNSARIGKYYYIQPKLGTNELQLIDDIPRHGKQFWLTASEAGRKCAVVDVPKIGLGPPVKGIQLANWGAHATRCDTASHPPGLVDDVILKHGKYPLHSCDEHGLEPREYQELRRQLIAGVERRTEVLLDLLSSDEWDLYFAAYSETHCSGHQFWHFQDPTHPRYDPEDRHGLHNAMRDVYQAVDRGMGRLLDAVGPETSVVVFSGHGMRAQYHGRDLLPILLEMWGMAGTENVQPDPSRERHVAWKKTWVRALKDNVPIQWQYAVKKMLPSKLESAIICRVMGAERLPTTWRAFYVPNNDLTAAIRVNLKGRDPGGLVAAGREYNALCDWLSTRLLELVNTATGKPAVDKVSKIHDLYDGPFLDKLPDLTALWSQKAWIDELHSPGYGTVSGVHTDLRTGGHAAQGFMILRATEARLGNTQDANAKDVAPTVLDLLDVPIPDSMEGRSLATQAEVVG
ncbi:MAG: alkaline phosphatase family protein [Acidobacteria bacterium]|nr:alkaline phosphatase family protein [Acidobacteriota bacterium]